MPDEMDAERNGPGLMFFRAAFIVFLLLVLIYELNPSVQCAIKQKWDNVRHQYHSFEGFMVDRQYEVPENERKPYQTYRQYAEDRKKNIKTGMAESTRLSSS